MAARGRLGAGTPQRPCGALARTGRGRGVSPRSAWGLVPACLCLTVAASVAPAHDTRQQIAPDDPVELTFGRTEAYDYDPPEPGSYRLPPLGAAADGLLLDPEGRTRSLHRAMDGHITVLAFIYTRCSDPQGCPLTMALLHDLDYVGAVDPVIGRALRLITVSFDPEHDTPDVLKDFAESVSDDGRDDERWLFLTAATQTDMKPILDAYRQQVGRKVAMDDPFGPFTHQLRVYLIDAARRIRNIYSLGFLDPRLVIADVRTLLLEEATKRPRP